MQRHEFKSKLIDFAYEWCPSDDCAEFDEMTQEDLAAFWLAIQAWMYKFAPTDFPSEADMTR